MKKGKLQFIDKVENIRNYKDLIDLTTSYLELGYQIEIQTRVVRGKDYETKAEAEYELSIYKIVDKLFKEE